MSLLAMVPLLVSVVICLGACFFVFGRKSLAQSLCVQETVRLQSELGQRLEKLLALNPKAQQLRRRREAADRALDIAYQSGDPDAIAIAKAVQLAVILEQSVLHSKQDALLAGAEEVRERHTRELALRLRGLRAQAPRARRYFPSGLAVRPVPASSLSPDYEPVPGFERLQQQRFEYRVDLTPPFLPREWKIEGLQQLTACSVSLKAEGKRWTSKILAASAS